MSGNAQFLPSNLSTVSGCVWELLDAIVDCRFKAHLRLQGEAGAKSDYELMLGELRDAVKRKAIAKISIPGRENSLWRGALLTRAVLRQGEAFILDADIETDLGKLHIDGVKKVAGYSKLGDFHYIPVLFCGGERVGKRHKGLAEAIGHFLALLQGQPPNRVAIYHSPECCLTTARLSPKLSHGSKLVDDLRRLRRASSAPELILNDHCDVCEFREQCRRQAVAEDNLSLLRGIGPKKLRGYARKGIFTVKQLAHTFRPRRKGRKILRQAPHYHALQAMAVRDNTVYLLGTPELSARPVEVYLDLEGDLNARRVYLIGMTVKDGSDEKHYAFWGDGKEEEMAIFQQLMATLGQYADFTVFSYGGYEKTFLKRMRVHAKPRKAVDRVLERMANVLSVIYEHVYFPCYSNGLKEIGRYLGYSWSDMHASGAQAAVWRTRWEASRNEEWKSRLLQYNREDCDALKKVTDFIRAAIAGSGNRITVPPPANDINVMAVPESEESGFDWKWGKASFVHSDFAQINKCAYFDYQRQRVYVRTNKSIRRVMKRRKQRANLRLRFSKHISITKNKCPSCKCSPVLKIAAKRRHAPHRKRAYNLAFTHSAVKRQVLAFYTKVHQCISCGHEFVPEEYVRLDRHFHGLKSFIMYLHVENRLSLEVAARIVGELFGICLSVQDVHMFKSLMARFYRHTYRLILRRLLSGKLLHVDETEVHLQREKGYVWVFTNLHEVLYMFRLSREGEFLKDLLLPFSGVLVSDFYSAYESLNCPQQKCLIHLIQDMNRSLLEAPYDHDLQLLTEPFGKLLRSIVSTIDRHGLKRRHLRHHEHDVAAYFRFLASTQLNSETAISLQSRLLHYREKLFTFLRYDGIPWNNNNAENAVKRFAYYRERTDKRLKLRGLCDYLTLLSISETCRYRGVSFLRFMLSGQKDISAFCEGKRQSRKHKTKAEMYPRGFLPLNIARLRRQFSKGGDTDSRLANDCAASG